MQPGLHSMRSGPRPMRAGLLSVRPGVHSLQPGVIQCSLDDVRKKSDTAGQTTLTLAREAPEDGAMERGRRNAQTETE